MRIDYYLPSLGFYVNPVKREGIYLEINHDQEAIINQPRPHVGINNLYFARQDVKKIMLSLNNSPGITEGVPFNIIISERGQSETIQMYLDLMNGLKRSNDGFDVAIKMLQSLDWLEDKVDAFTYESLYHETGVTTFSVDGKNYGSYKQFFDERCIYIPYVISTIPNARDAFMALFTAIFIGTQIVDLINKAKDILKNFQGLNFWAWVAKILEAIALFAYGLILIASLISMVKMMIQCLIQPLKYHGAMLMSDLLKITAIKLGLKFQSSIWDAYPFNQVAYLPEKYNPIVDSNPTALDVLGVSMGGYATKGYTDPAPVIQHGWFNGVGGDFLRLAKQIMNGKIIIPDQTNNLVLERADYFPANTPYQLPDIRQDWNGYNTDELMATIVISFAADLIEKNCIDKYSGTILQATHQQITTVDSRIVSLKGLREIKLPVARGIRKESLTFIEKAVQDIGNFMNDHVDEMNLIADSLILGIDPLILGYNIFVTTWNFLLDLTVLIVKTINEIINIATLGLVDPIDENFSLDALKLQPIALISLTPFTKTDFEVDNRIGALLLEDDMFSIPKLLLVDITRSEFTPKRIAYVHQDNQAVVNAENLWNKFYFIDAFVNPANSNDRANRFTKIAPALNSPDEINKVMISLADFKNLVSNPQFNDQFGEKVIADSIQWYIEKNGAAEFDFRKQGWLRDPQNKNGIKRSQEIAINLKIQLTIPTGQ